MKDVMRDIKRSVEKLLSQKRGLEEIVKQIAIDDKQKVAIMVAREHLNRINELLEIFKE